MNLHDNEFVKMYKKSRKEFPDYRDRHIAFRGIVSVIAVSGTFEDLKILDKYFELETDFIFNELGGMENESITTAV